MIESENHPNTSSNGTSKGHPSDAHQARIAAGSACLAMALTLQGMGFSPLRLCDPNHIGVSILPHHGKNCTNPGKVPLLPEWKPYQARQPTVEEIEKWWREYPIANVGLVLGVSVVRIDADGPASPQLLDEWSAGDLPDTWTFFTPVSPHPQRLYSWTCEAAAKTVVQKLEGIHSELKLLGFGGQTVIPPSRHPRGGCYKWLLGRSPDEIPLADAPAWLVECMTPKAKARSTSTPPRPPSPGEGAKQAKAILAAQLEKVTNALLGARHDTRIRAGVTIGGLVASGQLPESAIDELKEAAHSNADSNAEADCDIDDAVGYGMGRPFVPDDTGETSGLLYDSDKGQLDLYPLSDNFNAARLLRKFGRDFIYCGDWESHLVIDEGEIWIRDKSKKTLEMARLTALEMYQQASKAYQSAYASKKKADADRLTAGDDAAKKALDSSRAFLAHAKKTNNADSIRNMITLATPRVAKSYKEFNQHHYLLPVLNGVIDLCTGQLLPPDRSYLFTKIMPIIYDPSATCPIWEETLRTSLGGPLDKDGGSPEESGHVHEAWLEENQTAMEKVGFFKRAAGQSLTGDIREHMLLIMYGEKGRNGKGILLNTLLHMFGEFGEKVTQELLMETRNTAHPTERTDLYGRRLIVTSESDKRRRLNLSFVKELTGGDKLKARRMREDFWNFFPTHHVFLSTNHRPIIPADDNAMWERVYLLSFDRQFFNPDRLTEERRKHLISQSRTRDCKTNC